MWLIAAISSALVFGIGGFIYFSSIRKGYKGEQLLFGLYLAGSVYFFSLLISRLSAFSFSLNVLLFGMLIGIGSLFANYFIAKAFEVGPASLTSPLVNLNVLIVIFMSIFIFDETLTYMDICGIALLLFSVTLILYKPNKHKSIHSGWWYIFIALAIIFTFIREGGLKISDSLGMNNLDVLFYGYCFALIFISMKLFIIEGKTKNGYYIDLKALRRGAIIGCFSATGMTLFAYGIAHGPASIVAPIFSARSFVVALLALWIYKERLSRVQCVAVMSLLVGLMILAQGKS